MNSVKLIEVRPLPDSQGDDELYQEEVRDLELAKVQLQVQEHSENLEHRKRYASRIFKFVSIWMTMIFCVILLDGWGIGGLKISEKVLITLIGSTTLNVLGILAIVANYFFPKKDRYHDRS